MINMFKDTVLVSAAFCGFVLLCAAIENFPVLVLGASLAACAKIFKI